MKTLAKIFKETGATYVIARKAKLSSRTNLFQIEKGTEVTIFKTTCGLFFGSFEVYGQRLRRMRIRDSEGWTLLSYMD